MDICWERADLLGSAWAVLLNAVFFVFFFCVFLSRMMSGEGSGIREYRFLTIAVLSTLLRSNVLETFISVCQYAFCGSRSDC